VGKSARAHTGTGEEGEGGEDGRKRVSRERDNLAKIYITS
jgi:hypothetical protein